MFSEDASMSGFNLEDTAGKQNLAESSFAILAESFDMEEIFRVELACADCCCTSLMKGGVCEWSDANWYKSSVGFDDVGSGLRLDGACVTENGIGWVAFSAGAGARGLITVGSIVDHVLFSSVARLAESWFDIERESAEPVGLPKGDTNGEF